jgi:HlyD family secretion protein
MSKKRWILIGVVVLIGVLGLGGWRFVSGQQNINGEAQASTETAIVRQDKLVVTVEGTGNLAPSAEIRLAFLSGGQVAEILVEEGQVVEAGQPLVRLETDDLEFQVARAEAALAMAEGRLAQLLAPPQPEDVAAQQANLAAMEGGVSAAIANRDQATAGPSEAEIASAETQVAQAEMDYRAALRTYDSTDKKDEDKKEQANYDLWAADIALQAAQTQLDVLLAGATSAEARAAQANVTSAIAQRDAAQAQLDLLLAGATEEQIQAAEAAVGQARVALEQAQLSLERATLTASMAGAVTSLSVELGEMVNPGMPVVVLSDLTALEVNVNLDETDVARVAVGQEAQVNLDAFPGAAMTGEVTYIAPVADAASGVVLYPVTIRLTPADPSTSSGQAPSTGPSASSEQASGQALPIRAGMTADVEITTASQENALIVPLRAVHIESGQAYVDRLAGGQIERVDVELGLTTDTVAEIASGLAEGPALSLAEGDVVVVVAAASKDNMEGFRPPFMPRGD